MKIAKKNLLFSLTNSFLSSKSTY